MAVARWRCGAEVEKLNYECCETKYARPHLREHIVRARTTAITLQLHIAHVNSKPHIAGRVSYRCFAMKQHSRSKMGTKALGC